MGRQESVIRSVAVALFVSVAASAQNQRPLPARAPEQVVLSGVKVHIIASEDLEPDALRALARRDVTLWLKTRTNTLRASTLEQIARFDQAFVQLRAPLKPEEAASLAKAERVGAWVDLRTGQQLRGRLPGARRIEIELVGALTEAISRDVNALNPSAVRWSPGAPPDLLSWSLFSQTRGSKVVVLPAAALLPVKCERARGVPALEIDVSTLLAMSSDLFPCGEGTRVIVRPDTELWLLQSIALRDPSAELVIDVGADSELASKTRRLLEVLGRTDHR